MIIAYGSIGSRQKVLESGARTGKVPSFLFKKDILDELHDRGFLGKPTQVSDFLLYPITAAGREAFATNRY